MQELMEKILTDTTVRDQESMKQHASKIAMVGTFWGSVA